MVKWADPFIKSKNVANFADAIEELTASTRPCSGTASGRLLDPGLASRASERKANRKLSAMDMVPLLLFLSSAITLHLLRSSAIDWTQQLSGLSHDMYKMNTGISYQYSGFVMMYTAPLFWAGWTQRDSTLVIKPWQKALLVAPALLDLNLLPAVLMSWPMHWLGSTLGKASPQALFKAIPRMSQITICVLMLALTLHWGLSTIFPLLASNGVVSLFFGLLASLLPPMLLISHSTCRNPFTAIQFGLLVQLPLIISGAFYTIFSGVIAAMHAINYPALNAWMLSAGADAVITDAFPLWVKTGAIGLLALVYTAAAGLGGLLGALITRRRFDKLIRSSTYVDRAREET